MRTLLLFLAFSGLTIGSSFSSGAQDEDTPLQEAMSEVNSNLRSFRKALKGDQPDKEVALSKLLGIQAAVQRAKVEVPPSSEGQSAERGRAHTLAFRKDLIGLQKALLDLEVKVLDEKYSEIDVAIRGLLEKKKAGHDKYIEDA